MRHRSIRLRVFLLVVIPVLSLIGVYAYTATITGSAALSLSRAKTVKNATALPTSALQQQLDSERGLALLYLANPTDQALTKLEIQENTTSVALRRFQVANIAGPIASYASGPEKAAAKTLVQAANQLPALRARIAEGTISRPQVLDQYSAIVTAGYRVLEQAIQQNSSVPVVMSALNVVKLDEIDQVVLEESDLFTSDVAAGSFPPGDRVEFTQLVALRRYLTADAVPQLAPAYRAIYHKDVSPEAATALALLENTIIRAPGPGLPPVQRLPWAATVGAYSTGLNKALTASSDAVAQHAQQDADASYLRLALACGIGLLAIVVSVLFSLLVGRGLVGQLAELRESALDLANDRLPSVMRRLRDGESVDVAVEAPPVESSADEIDQVRQAFNIATRTAIQAAVDEASLRRGVNEVFRNLARRSQVLLHRQLNLLDGMERRASEPDELEDLFRIDHLTTRMRRHAEGLIILSGESPGRAWRHPVPLVDVLRAAVAEVEDYQRIRVESRTAAGLAGHAVADVIHLIAELAENATVFSPPNTPVRIVGDMAARGFAVEIEDRGLGITAERLTQINENLSSPSQPVFDLSGSDRLGLYIAGRLARRHDIGVQLRTSPYGGTTAVVLIPLALVVSGNSIGQAPALDRRGLPAGSRRAALGTGLDIEDTMPAGPAMAWLARPGGANGAAGRSGTREAGTGDFAAPPPAAVPSGNRTMPPAPPRAAPSGAAPSGTEAAPAGTAPPENGTPPPGNGTAAGSRTTEGGLPIRVRQANLVPQLRNASPAAGQVPGAPGGQPGGTAAGTPGSTAGGAARPASAEAARSTMAALQSGWERGRSAPTVPAETNGATGPNGPAAPAGSAAASAPGAPAESAAGDGQTREQEAAQAAE
ncbi:MAG TPA: nitrate- and nitrite sensing domain-containing protein [Streptosporangiaceae bacterium]